MGARIAPEWVSEWARNPQQRFDPHYIRVRNVLLILRPVRWFRNSPLEAKAVSVNVRVHLRAALKSLSRLDIASFVAVLLAIGAWTAVRLVRPWDTTNEVN